MLTSIGAMVATVLLIIFLGAWAVSAAGDSDFSSLANTATAGFAGTPYDSGTAPAVSDADSVPRLASATPVSETWWGKSFLVACPLH